MTTRSLPPAPSLFPIGMDALLSARQDTMRLATYAITHTRHPYRLAGLLVEWSLRMDDRAAELAKDRR